MDVINLILKLVVYKDVLIVFGMQYGDVELVVVNGYWMYEFF